MLSDAVSINYVSATVGYKVEKGNFQSDSPNLPQRIAVFGEVNDANQSTYDTDPKEIITSQQAGEEYGFGSPIHMACRILLPINGPGVDGIPVWVYPQAAAGGATPKVMEINPLGVATANAVHTIVMGGREDVDGERYDVAIATGDNAAAISAKITDVINNVLGCPMVANDSSYSAICTSKWSGLTAEDITISIDRNNSPVGITYTTETISSGSATPSITASLNLFGETWNTLIVNTYGAVSAVMDSLESFNGIADPNSPTGRFQGIVWKPFIALTGSTLDDPSTLTDSRKAEMTIAICPAPLSPAHPLEAAANACVLFAKLSQNNPHKDILNQAYPDMPVPSDENIGSMADYAFRDSFVKKGCSTVAYSSGKYVVKDFVTTYHPVGESVPQFRYCRNLMLDFNVAYGYNLLVNVYVIGATIANNTDATRVAGVIKPKQWKQVISKYFEDLVERALVADLPFTLASLDVQISGTTPYRLETFLRYKRTSTARISSTTVQAGFNYGNQ